MWRFRLSCTACLMILLSSTVSAEQVVTLSSLKAAIASFQREGHADPTFPIDLSGYSFHWEVDLGEGQHYVIISQNLEGQILGFSDDGTLIHQLKTTEIKALEICDLNADLRFELITTQVDSRGTGVIEEKFHVYEAGKPFLRELWSGVAYSSLPYEEKPGKIEYRESRGFLSCGGGGLQYYLEKTLGSGSKLGVLSHLCYTSAGTLEPKVDGATSQCPP